MADGVYYLCWILYCTQPKLWSVQVFRLCFVCDFSVLSHLKILLLIGKSRIQEVAGVFLIPPRWSSKFTSWNSTLEKIELLLLSLHFTLEYFVSKPEWSHSSHLQW